MLPLPQHAIYDRDNSARQVHHEIYMWNTLEQEPDHGFDGRNDGDCGLLVRMLTLTYFIQ